MSENSVNVVSDYHLKEDNQRITYDLYKCLKKIEILENYRKTVLKFIELCVCKETNGIKTVVKSLEEEYNRTSSELNSCDNQLDGNRDEENPETFVDNTNDKNLIAEEVVITEGPNGSEEEVDMNDKEIDVNSHQINDKLVLVFNKQTNCLLKKSSDNIDTNTESIVNKFVIRRSEDYSNDTNQSFDELGSDNKRKGINICQEIRSHSESGENPEQQINDKTPNICNTSPMVLNLKETTNLSKILLVIPSVSVPESQQKLKPKRNRFPKSIKRGTSGDSNDGNNLWHLSQEYKQKNKVFNLLLDQLKKGRIESFVDPNYELISVSLQKDNSSEDQNSVTVVYKCSYNECRFVSKTSYASRRHAQRHNKDCAFVCQFCNKSFNLRAYLAQHLRLVHNIKGKPLIKCEFPGCEFKTVNKNQLKTHYVSHSDERTVKCEQMGCNSYFKSTIHMRAHMKLHSEEKRFGCQWPGCEATFKSKAYSKKHFETHTGKSNSISKLKKVLQTGNYVSTVDKNNNLFSVIRQQVVNPNTGKVGIGPQMGFKCNYSGCKFASIFKHLVSQHVSTHLFGKTFECNLCDKKFGLQKYLTQHKKTVHNIDNSPTIRCPVADCHYTTTYRLGLRIHSLTHQTEKPFNCDINGCDKSFKTSVLLRWHQNNRHLKSRPYVCDYAGCELAFEVKDQLRRHIKSHTKPFRCHYQNCSKSYKKKPDLNRHLREKH